MLRVRTASALRLQRCKHLAQSEVERLRESPPSRQGAIARGRLRIPPGFPGLDHVQRRSVDTRSTRKLIERPSTIVPEPREVDAQRSEIWISGRTGFGHASSTQGGRFRLVWAIPYYWG